MNEESIGFKEISEVHRSEKRSKSLTRLPHRFFELAQEHLEELKKQYSDKAANPASTDALVLQDNMLKINKRLCQIYDLRERKIVIAALSGVSGGQQPKDMTKKEISLYNEVIKTLKSFRECPVDAIPAERQTTITVPSVKKSAEPIVERDVPAEPAEEAEILQTCLVRVLEEIPPFVDVDRTYTLKKEDVVTLPEKFARILSAKGAVKILDF